MQTNGVYNLAHMACHMTQMQYSGRLPMAGMPTEEQQLECGKSGMAVHVGVSSEAWMTSLSLAAQIRLRQVLNTEVARLCPHVCV